MTVLSEAEIRTFVEGATHYFEVAARQKAAALAAQMQSGDFDKAAKAAGLEVKTTDFIARGAPIGEAGVSPALEDKAFALPAGSVSGAVVTGPVAVAPSRAISPPRATVPVVSVPT